MVRLILSDDEHKLQSSSLRTCSVLRCVAAGAPRRLRPHFTQSAPLPLKADLLAQSSARPTRCTAGGGYRLVPFNVCRWLYRAPVSQSLLMAGTTTRRVSFNNTEPTALHSFSVYSRTDGRLLWTRCVNRQHTPFTMTVKAPAGEVPVSAVEIMCEFLTCSQETGTVTVILFGCSGAIGAVKENRVRQLCVKHAAAATEGRPGEPVLGQTRQTGRARQPCQRG